MILGQPEALSVGVNEDKLPKHIFKLCMPWFPWLK